MGRYTVVYEGDPTDVKILSGEPPQGKAITVGLGDLYADAARSEKHRNDLMDSLVELRTERSALKARIDTLEIVLRNARHMVAGGNALGSTADMLRLLASPDDRGGPSPTREEARERAAMLESAERAMVAALYPEPDPA